MTVNRTALPAGGRSLARSLAGLWTLLVLGLSVVGCAGGQLAPGQGEATPPPHALAIEADIDADGKSPDQIGAVAVASSPVDDALAERRFSRDRRALRAQVADACRQFGESGDPARLRLLVAALYASKVDPGAAAEAMRRARCATPSEIVFEMVGQGGEASAAGVVAQFEGVRDPAGRKLIESALADGLARYAGESAAGAGEVSEQRSDYGMLYLPSVGDSARWDSSIALNRLYEDAIPGYGIYTFVILGRGFADGSGKEAIRYRELFRVLETYVASAEQESGQPDPELHVFLIPIKLGELDAPLVDQVAGDLSEHMRLVLISDLRHRGQARLAAKLERGAGPFLVSTLEPHLVPASDTAPRLVADLSAIGPEYIYGVIDAYDRAQPVTTGAQAKRLKALLERLREMPVQHAEPAPATDQGDSRKGQDGWLFPLGGFAAAADMCPSIDMRPPVVGAPEPTPAGGASSYT